MIAKCRANRFVDYTLQQAGIPMIPTAGFADESSWEWCFDGLLLNSTVAVTTNCLGRDREAHRLFVGGINTMVEKIHPTAIVVCGKVPDWLSRAATVAKAAEPDEFKTVAITTATVLKSRTKTFPDNLWFAKNDDELRCVVQTAPSRHARHRAENVACVVQKYAQPLRRRGIYLSQNLSSAP